MALQSSSKRVTRGDVAAHAGVSPALVSYVLNNGPGPVAAATRERVLASMSYLGYRPNTAARTLKNGSSKSIGLIISDSLNLFASEVSVAVQREADRLGLAVFVVYFEGEPQLAEKAIKDLVSRQVDGIVLVSSVELPDTRAATETRTPLVILGQQVNHTGIYGIGVDIRAGAYDAVEHLLWHGHTSIGLIVGPEKSAPAYRREAGWSDALAAHDLPPGRIFRTEFSAQGGYEAGREFVGMPERPTALFVSTDRQAIGTLRAIHEAGLRIPDDVALVSFDGNQDSAYAWPPLTTMAQPAEVLAVAAVQHLSDGQIPDAGTLLVPRLVVRASCGCVYPAP
ncbi:MAG: LacI family DNA-binding transcriptional regulator [Rhodoglobus sp.]